MEDPGIYILRYLTRNGPIPGATDAERMACDYIQTGVLDSMRLIDLILELERVYDVTFDSADYGDPRFKTVGGLIHILAGKRS